jgi:hypothetical protein
METYITPRITAIRDEYLQARPSVCINRALAFTDVYRRNPGLPTVIKRARAFRAACERAPLAIFDNELLISHPAGRRRGENVRRKSPGAGWPMSWIRLVRAVRTRMTLMKATNGACGKRFFPSGKASHWMKWQKRSCVRRGCGAGVMRRVYAI